MIPSEAPVADPAPSGAPVLLSAPGTLGDGERPAVQEFAGYRIESVLGEGGNAVVYLAERAGGGTKVALKVLRRQGRTADSVARFKREIAVLAGLDSPRFLPVLDSGVTDGDLWYVMPYSRSESLEEVLKRRLGKGGTLELREVLNLGRTLADALAYLHDRGICHRDLKPDNLLVGEAMSVQVMDFGLAKALDHSELTAEGVIMGTPRYMSPEQVMGKEADARSDVYQAGLVLYRALTGSLPLEDKSPFATAMRRTREPVPPAVRANPITPPGLDRILLRALRSDPKERYRDGGELLGDLMRLDRTTGRLLPGADLPGLPAERTVGPEPVPGVAAGGSRPAGTRALVRGSSAGGPDPESRGAGGGRLDPETRPTPGKAPRRGGGRTTAAVLVLGAPGPGRWVAATLGLAFGVAVALLAWSRAPGQGRIASSGTVPLAVEDLLVEPLPGRLEVSFRTSYPVRAGFRVGEGPEVLISPVPTSDHVGAVDGLDPGAEVEWTLRLRDPADGPGAPPTSTLTDRVRIPTSGGGSGVRSAFSGLRATREGDRIRVTVRTEDPSTCGLLVGEGEDLGTRIEAATTGGKSHAFEVPALPGSRDPRRMRLSCRDGEGRSYASETRALLPGGSQRP